MGVREIYVARLPVPVYTTGPNFFTTNPYFQKKFFFPPEYNDSVGEINDERNDFPGAQRDARFFFF